MKNIKYAVVTSYNFDPDVPIALFHSEKAAMKYMRKQWEEEKRIDAENGWESEANFYAEEGRAEIKTTFLRNGSEEVDVTTWTLTSNINLDTPLQESGEMYRMQLVFSVDVSKPELNRILAACGEPRPIFPGICEATITQTLDRVPTRGMLDAYAEALSKAYESKECHVENVKFLRYDYIYPIEEAGNKEP